MALYKLFTNRPFSQSAGVAALHQLLLALFVTGIAPDPQQMLRL
jgi:hypothetical protein